MSSHHYPVSQDSSTVPDAAGSSTWSPASRARSWHAWRARGWCWRSMRGSGAWIFCRPWSAWDAIIRLVSVCRSAGIRCSGSSTRKRWIAPASRSRAPPIWNGWTRRAASPIASASPTAGESLPTCRRSKPWPPRLATDFGLALTSPRATPGSGMPTSFIGKPYRRLHTPGMVCLARTPPLSRGRSR